MSNKRAGVIIVQRLDGRNAKSTLIVGMISRITRYTWIILGEASATRRDGGDDTDEGESETTVRAVYRRQDIVISSTGTRAQRAQVNSGRDTTQDIKLDFSIENMSPLPCDAIGCPFQPKSSTLA
ncbi:hypothetical protein KFK09_010360 [Dendrobium nobile]|uniref:Uncharacterized protein n=1 Tax=Dendrobium nobile TaxID=94219 RepID=A0A8T3BMT3_DENNO|nr:hypothetical protein KFK09_010360 [Dendrobium nobile]